MNLVDLHVHTNYCHGDNSPEEMVRAALDLGMECIGFTSHAYTEFDVSYCMTQEATAAYLAEIRRLQEQYRGKIRILCGTEQDYFSTVPDPSLYDYRIGSVHYLDVGDKYLDVDRSPENQLDNVKNYYGGDFYRMTEHYFELVGDVIAHTGADIIGHFDLIDKFNESGELFDVKNPRYISAAEKAMDRLLATGRPFEINCGAIPRGYRSIPYPHPQFLKKLKEKGAKVFLTGDTHNAKTLCFEFEKWSEYVKDFGFTDMTPPTFLVK